MYLCWISTGHYWHTLSVQSITFLIVIFVVTLTFCTVQVLNVSPFISFHLLSKLVLFRLLLKLEFIHRTLDFFCCVTYCHAQYLHSAGLFILYSFFHVFNCSKCAIMPIRSQLSYKMKPWSFHMDEWAWMHEPVGREGNCFYSLVQFSLQAHTKGGKTNSSVISFFMSTMLLTCCIFSMNYVSNRQLIKYTNLYLKSHYLNLKCFLLGWEWDWVKGHGLLKSPFIRMRK